jgi:hypothetical protein
VIREGCRREWRGMGIGNGNCNVTMYIHTFCILLVPTKSCLERNRWALLIQAFADKRLFVFEMHCALWCSRHSFDVKM